jgi:hypothetical protein
MSRLYTGGAELGQAQADGLTVSNAPTIDTAVKRSGVASFKATATNTYHQRAFAGVLARTYFIRAYYRIPSAPTGLHRPFQVGQSSGTAILALEMVNGTNVLRLLNGLGTTLATGTKVLSANTWYRIEISLNMAAAGNSAFELRIDGVTDISGSFTLNNAAPGQLRFGCTSGNIGGLAAIYHDDVAINDDQGADQNSWPGVGAVYALLGAADPGTGTATANWTKPGGATTNRHTSVGKPLVYQADSTLVADAEKFVRNPTNAASEFEIDMTDYTAGGVPSGETIRLIQPVAGTGSTSATDTTGSIECLSNPVIASKALTTFDNGIASSTPTTWPRADGDVVYNPTVTRDTRPRVRLSRAAANRIVMCNMVALVVETGPSVQYGATSLAVTFGKEVQAQRKTFGQIAFPIGVSIFTAGNRLANTLYGSMSLPIVFGAVIDGKRKTLGQLALPIIFNKDVRGQRKTFGQLLSPFIFGKEVSGRRTTFGQTIFPITIGIATAGLRLGLTFYGTLALPITFGKDVRGQRKAFGQVGLPLTFVKDVRGQRKTFGQLSLPIIFTKEAIGRKNVFGQLSMQTLFGKEIAGRRKTFSQLTMPMIFSKAVTGRKQTFGRVALPIDFQAFVNGQIFIGPKTYYGQLAMPLAFGKQVAARRKTFGQITAPFIFGSASKGQRHTFSELELPIDFLTYVKSGPVGKHGIVELELVLEMNTDGKITIAGVILNDALELYLGDQNILAAYVGSEKVWP